MIRIPTYVEPHAMYTTVSANHTDRVDTALP
jgi:hypothetical protein